MFASLDESGSSGSGDELMKIRRWGGKFFLIFCMVLFALITVGLLERGAFALIRGGEVPRYNHKNWNSNRQDDRHVRYGPAVTMTVGERNRYTSTRSETLRGCCL